MNQRVEGVNIEIVIKGQGGTGSFHLHDNDQLTITVDGCEVIRANASGVTWVRSDNPTSPTPSVN